MAAARRVLVISALENLQLLVARALGNEGWAVAAAGSSPGATLRLSRHCREYRRVAESAAALAEPDEAVLERLVEVGRDAELVVPVDVAAALLAPRLKERLPGALFFPSPEPETLKLLDDKWRFYGFLREEGLPAPRSWLVTSAEEARGLPLPLVLKPLAETGGRGIVPVFDAEARERRLSAPGGLPAVAQEYVPGNEVSLAFLADRGRLLAWTMHVRDRQGVLRFLDDPRVLELGRRIVERVGYHGIGDIDMRYDDRDADRVHVIEANPRFWGSFEYTLGFGVDFLGRGLALARGSAPKPFPAAPTGECPGFAAWARRSLRGRFALPEGSRVYLRQKLGDPLPELFRGLGYLLP